jgi:periplasmic copper chaperone A
VNMPARIGFSVLLASALALSACQQRSEPAPQEEPAVSTGPEAKPGLSLDSGKLVLPAVKGRPGAVYFSFRNGGDAAVTLAGAHVDGAAKAEMHETLDGSMATIATLDVAAGETVEFAPGGKHVMAFELADNLIAGGTTELTLTLADGDKISAPLDIELRGSADHGSGH